MVLLYCIVASISGLLIGLASYWLFRKPPNPREVTVGKAMLPCLDIGELVHPCSDRYRVTFAVPALGNGPDIEATDLCLSEAVRKALFRLFNLYRSRGAYVQWLNQELRRSRYQGRCQEAALRDLNKRLAQVSSDLAIYKDQANIQAKVAFDKAGQIEMLAQEIRGTLCNDPALA